MPSFTSSESEEIVARLAHDLRQPLGNIESSAYYINLLLGHEHTAVREQLRLIERQVDQAVRILNESLAAARGRRDHRATTAAESLGSTKTAAAALT